MVILTGNVFLFGDGGIAGPNQFALILAGLLAALVAQRFGTDWTTLNRQISLSFGFVSQSVIILLLVGGLMGAWLLSGTVPALIYWGTKFLSTDFFLVSSVVICSLVSLITGSSWSTAGTIGLALMGVGHVLGLPAPLTAGAVISGAYFGDKMSPFSETTNLASSMTGVPLFRHIRHMLYSTAPAWILTLIAFTLINLFTETAALDADRMRVFTKFLENSFYLNWPVLLPLAFLLLLIVARVAVIPALTAGILAGIFTAILTQGVLLDQLTPAGNTTSSDALTIALHSVSQGLELKSGPDQARQLLNRGGMAGMLNTIWLILSAMFFSGIMEGGGLIQVISRAIVPKGRTSTGRLVTTTTASGTFFNLSTSEQYLSIVLTGRMFQNLYKKNHLAPENLSRAMEDSGTLTSALIPWNTCGAFMASTLGVPVLTYLPFAIFNWLTPLISIALSWLNFGINRLPEETTAGEAPK